MNTRIITIAYATLTTTIYAQDFSLSIIPSTTDVGLNHPLSFNLNIYGDSSAGTHLLGGAFLLIETENGDGIDSISWHPADWSSFNTDNGYSGNGVHNQVIFGQLVIPNVPPFDIPAEGSELGERIGTFIVNTSSTPHNGYYSFQLLAGNPFTLETYSEVTGESFNSSNGNLHLGSTRVFSTPSPSTLAIFLFAGIATRRNRTINDIEHIMPV